MLYEWLKESNKPLDDRLCTTVREEVDEFELKW